MKYLLPFILVLTLAACSESKSTYSGRALPADQPSQQPAHSAQEQPPQPVQETAQAEDYVTGKRMIAAISNSWIYADIVCWDAKKQNLFVHFSKKEAEEHQGWWLLKPPYDKVFLEVGNNTLSLKTKDVGFTALGNVTTTGLECLEDATRR